MSAITAGIKMYKSVITKTRKHHEIKFLAKVKLRTIEVLVSEAFIDS